MEDDSEKIIPRYLCEEVAKLSVSDAKLTKRPWDRFRPDFTSWYLVPSTSVTYYKFGKLYFSKDKETSDSIGCGMFFEKGLGESLGIVYSTKQAKPLMMDSTWFWHKFVSESSKDNFPFKKANLDTSLGSLKVKVEGGYVTEPNSFDPYKMRMLKWDKYVFDYNINKDLFSVSESQRESFVLKLHGIKSFSDFVSSLKELEKDEWLWLNIFIYTELKTNISDIKSDSKLIYDRLLKSCSILIKD
ncbi:MAG: hypothetical protein WCR55_07580 [Lentisphaerota bacterium]